jgi:hypothetical protein
MSISSEALFSLRALLRNMVNDYLGINASMLVACNQDLMTKLLSEKGISTQEKTEDVIQKPQRKTLDGWDIEPEDPSESNVMDTFSSEFTDDKINVTKQKIMIENDDDVDPPSVNYAYSDMHSLSSAILFINEHSSEDSFAPLHRIIKENVPYEEWAMFFGHDYFRKNAYILCSIKDTIKKYVKDGGKIGFIPSFRLLDKIVPGMIDMWSVAVTFAAQYVPLAKTVRMLSRYENDLVKNDVDKLEITRFIIHNIFYPMFLSIHPRFMDRFKLDVASRIECNNRDGMYDDMKSIYNGITGGTLDISTPTISSALDNITSMFDEYPILSEEHMSSTPLLKTSKAVKEYVMSKIRGTEIDNESNNKTSLSKTEPTNRGSKQKIGDDVLENTEKDEEEIYTTQKKGISSMGEEFGDKLSSVDEIFTEDLMNDSFDIDAINRLINT